MIDSEQIQADFTIYAKYQADTGKSLVYLDSASTSLTPDSVVSVMHEYYSTYRANIERSSFSLAVRAESAYEAARIGIANFIQADTSEIIFTSGATDAANKLVRMLVQEYKNNSTSSGTLRVLTSVREHHAVLVTVLSEIGRGEIELKYIESDDSPELTVELFQKAVTDFRPHYVFLQHANNVTGEILDMQKFAEVSHSAGAKLFCDGSQAVGHIEVNVKKLGVDAYFFSGHKMLGPTGVGVLYIEPTLLSKLSPVTFGGNAVSRVRQDGFELRPGIKQFEPGTQNIAGVIGLGAAVEYIQTIGIGSIVEHTQDMLVYAKRELSQIPEVHLYAASHNVGIVSFYIDNIHTHDIESMLSDAGIAVRSGYHCAEVFVRHISAKPLTRISLHIYNTQSDIDALIQTLQTIVAKFK
jgi:cysteine desulfurase / selenocysteine lyase